VGIIQKDALKTTLVSYLGLILGYLNKGVLFLIFLSTEQIGLLSLILSVGLLFAQFSNLGMSYTVWRFFPFLRNKDKQNFGFFQFSILVTSIGIVLFTVLSVVLKDFICSLYLEKSKLFVDYYYWMLPIGVSYALFMTFDVFLRGLYKNIISVIATELILRLIVTVAIVMYALKWISFFELLVLHSISFAAPTFILALQLFRNKELHWRMSKIAIPKRFKRIIFSYSLYSYINFIGIMVVISIDTVMVASMVGLGATGVFSTIIFIVSGLLIPYKSLVRISSPFVAKYWKERDMTRMSDLYTRISSIGLVIGLVTFLVFWVNRFEIFHFLPPEFSDGMIIFLILMIGRIVDMYCGLNGVIFVTSKKYKYDLIFTMFLLLSVYFLNLFLIPAYGIFGAAISTTAAYIFYNLCRLLFVFFAYKIHPFKWSQIIVIALFLIILALFEFAPVLFGNELISIGIKLMAVSVLFLFPIYWFKLDNDVVDYSNSLLKKVFKRFNQVGEE
jgi:O-antigen/teichoic acid export membrane protein